MNDRHDLELLLKSGPPIVVVETTDEARFLGLLAQLATSAPADAYRPLYRWTVTDGLQRLDIDLAPQRHNSEPQEVLRHIRAVRKPGVYALLDFHPFLADPLNVRLLKDIAIEGQAHALVLLLISHSVTLPPELASLAAHFEMRLPDASERRAIVRRQIDAFVADLGRDVHVDSHAMDLLVHALGGLPHADVERLARTAVRQDGAITTDDVPAVKQAKYRLLNSGGVLSYEHDTASLEDVAGFRGVKVWLQQRRLAFTDALPPGLDPPKGILLIGVQGCGKSLAAKAAAGALGLPLLRMDFGSLYAKYHGETERNLRESLNTAETMSPCVLWLDEIEKGLATGDNDSGTSHRVLGTLLTWMAENRARVLLVATANDVSRLPPELVRKGRFDEIFFVDLPGPAQRADIFSIHMGKRQLGPGSFDLPSLVGATDGFSGAEIEQAIVSALYAAHAVRQEPTTGHVLAEIRRTRPLSVVMAERVAELRQWAKDRTVPAD